MRHRQKKPTMQSTRISPRHRTPSNCTTRDNARGVTRTNESSWPLRQRGRFRIRNSAKFASSLHRHRGACRHRNSRPPTAHRMRRSFAPWVAEIHMLRISLLRPPCGPSCGLSLDPRQPRPRPHRDKTDTHRAYHSTEQATRHRACSANSRASDVVVQA